MNDIRFRVTLRLPHHLWKRLYDDAKAAGAISLNDYLIATLEARVDGVEKGMREAAHIARNACLVPPDGGSPTEAEAALCDEAANRILAAIPSEAVDPTSIWRGAFEDMRIQSVEHAKQRNEALRALAALTDAFLSRHGCFPLDKVTEEQRQWHAAMTEAYRLVGQPRPGSGRERQAMGNAELDAGAPNHFDPNKRGFNPR